MKAILVLAALTVGFYWKLTLSREFTFLAAPDLANQILPWYEFQARAWHSGVFPLWDPHQWCGQPLIGQMQPGATFPLNWPLFLAPLKNGRLNLDLFHWHFVLMHLLAALFMYAFCRELERSRFAAVLAGAGFSFAGYVGTTIWPQMMNGALWTPLIFLFCHRALRAGTPLVTAASAAGCGASMGLAFLAGHHQPPLFVSLAVAGVLLYRRRIRLLALTGTFATLVGAFALLPAWEYSSRAYRWLNLPSPLRMDETVPYLAHQGLGLIPLSLLGVATPVDQVTANPFVGLVALSLALFGVTSSWAARPVRLYACLALAGLAYSLGSYSVFQGALYALVPFLDKARSPGQAVLLFHFGLLVAAAYGADALMDSTRRHSYLVRGLLAAAVLGLGAQLLLSLAPGPASSRAQSLMLTSVIALALAALVHTGKRAGLFLLLLLEVYAGTPFLILPRTDPEKPNHLDRLRQHREVVAFLRSQPRPFRFEVDEQEIPYNIGDWEGLEASAGYLASVSADLYDFVGLDWTHTALMLNQVFMVARQKTRPEQVEAFAEAESGLKVFRNPDVYPRAWLVSSVKEVPDRPAAVALMQSRDFDPRREAFLFARRGRAMPALDACQDGGSVEIVAQEIHRVAARVRAPCRMMVVFGDPFFPGWEARVDGAPAQLYDAYGALRGIEAPAGEHLVETIYRPLSVYLGASLTTAGLMGWLLLVLASRRANRLS